MKNEKGEHYIIYTLQGSTKKSRTRRNSPRLSQDTVQTHLRGDEYCRGAIYIRVYSHTYLSFTGPK